jgi:hypothetical protein
LKGRTRVVSLYRRTLAERTAMDSGGRRDSLGPSVTNKHNAHKFGLEQS